MYRITVGICTKNSERTIEGTINSIINQDFPLKDIEIIVVDGNSQDKTISIIKSAISKSKLKSKFFYDKGKGLGAARQIVVDNARSEYIMWVDSDVVLAKDFFRKQLEFMEKNPKVVMAKGISQYIESKNDLSADIQSLFLNIARRTAVSMGATICRTKAFRAVNGFDTRIKGAAEDIDIEIRLLARGWKTAVNNEVEFRHNSRETIRDVFKEYSWYGYGGHFINHKHEGFINIIHLIPPIYFLWGLKVARKAYHRFHVKKSFLIPLLCLIMSIGYCFGFAKSHTEGYGHTILRKKRKYKLFKS